MKAIRVYEFGDPQVLQIEDVPDPQPGAGQVMVRLHAVGVNPVETYIRSGTYAMKPTLPYTPGSDAAGTVEAVGDGVPSVKVGDRVYTAGTLSGAYAELALCEAGQVHPLPEGVSFQQGAGINTPYATAYRALFQRARAISGETVLVHGASGGVGIAAVQLARAAGLTVIGTAGTPEGLQLVTEQGAQYALNHHDSDYLQELLAINCARGVDVIIEMLANVNLGRDLTVLAKGGRVVVVGSRGKVEINPRDAMARDAAILGMTLPNVPPTELAAIHAAIGTGLTQGTLRPIIGRELPLAEAAAAHEAVMQPGAHGKIVLIP